jgi:hypothetical protein
MTDPTVHITVFFVVLFIRCWIYQCNQNSREQAQRQRQAALITSQQRTHQLQQRAAQQVMMAQQQQLQQQQQQQQAPIYNMTNNPSASSRGYTPPTMMPTWGEPAPSAPLQAEPVQQAAAPKPADVSISAFLQDANLSQYEASFCEMGAAFASDLSDVQDSELETMVSTTILCRRSPPPGASDPALAERLSLYVALPCLALPAARSRRG